jgi:hypothetical protein
VTRSVNVDYLPAQAPGISSPAPAPFEIDHLPPRWNPTPPVPSLPIGVAVLSVLTAGLAVIVVLTGVLVLLNLAIGWVVPSSLLLLGPVDLLGATLLVVFGIILIGVASALWHQETWALWTTIVVVFFSLTYLFFTASITVLFLCLLVVFVYLLTVRHHFY